MAFSIGTYHVGSYCDKCHKEATPDNPIITFTESKGKGRAWEYHKIRLHQSCLTKIMAKVRTGGME